VRKELGLPVKRPSFSVVARAVIEEIHTTQSNGLGKVVYRDYIAVLERYLIPFFGRLMFEEITPEVIADFDAWRNTQIGKVPRASTMRTHASAFNRVLDAVRASDPLQINKKLPLNTIKYCIITASVRRPNVVVSLRLHRQDIRQTPTKTIRSGSIVDLMGGTRH
jgi:hypothetical protein